MLPSALPLLLFFFLLLLPHSDLSAFQLQVSQFFLNSPHIPPQTRQKLDLTRNLLNGPVLYLSTNPIPLTRITLTNSIAHAEDRFTSHIQWLHDFSCREEEQTLSSP